MNTCDAVGSDVGWLGGVRGPAHGAWQHGFPAWKGRVPPVVQVLLLLPLPEVDRLVELPLTVFRNPSSSSILSTVLLQSAGCRTKKFNTPWLVCSVATVDCGRDRG